MKKHLLKTIFFVGIASIVQAQPVLNSSEMLPYGSLMIETSISNLSVINTSIQGTGVTWNFASITNSPTVPDLYVYVVNPASTPYGGSFPSSNYAWREEKGSSINYRYFSLTPAKMERVGSYVTNLNTYSDPQVEYVYPLQMGVTNFDTWDNTNSSSGGTYDLEVVGTGTLIIPIGTFNNVLMVKVHMVEAFIDFYSYFWYSSDNGAILLQYIEGDGLFIPESGIHMTTLTTGIADNIPVTNLQFNNPVRDEFNLSFDSQIATIYSYSVVNSIGQIIMQDEIRTAAGPESLSLDFSNLPAGLYYFSLSTSENGQLNKTLKLVKQ